MATQYTIGVTDDNNITLALHVSGHQHTTKIAAFSYLHKHTATEIVNHMSTLSTKDKKKWLSLYQEIYTKYIGRPELSPHIINLLDKIKHVL